MRPVHVQHVCRTSGRVEEREKGGPGSDRRGAYTALNALGDTCFIVFITRQWRTVHIAMWVNLKNIVLSGKDENEMHRLVFPEVKKLGAQEKTLCAFCEHSCKHRYTSSTLESLPVGWGTWKRPKGIKGINSICKQGFCPDSANHALGTVTRGKCDPVLPRCKTNGTKSSAFLFLLGVLKET